VLQTFCKHSAICNAGIFVRALHALHALLAATDLRLSELEKAKLIFRLYKETG
jgi:hypothetical protein